MTRPILLLLFLLSLLPDARAQAVISPPPRPPAVRPVVNPPDFPTPGATPAGAGLPGERVPNSIAPAVSRSPNKRLLPTSSEPGLWAADGAPHAVAPPRLFGVDLVFPDAAKDLFERDEAFICLSTMTRAAQTTGTEALIMRAPPFARRCMATQAFAFCLISMREDLAERKRTGQGYDHEEFTAISAMAAHARALGKTNCQDLGVELVPDEQKALDALAAHIIRVMKGEVQP
jgi:hypothetical protein